MNEGAMNWLGHAVRGIDAADRQRALAHQARLTKPAGALGELEALAVRLSAMQRCERPAVDRVQIVVFAADHGVATEGVSAFPQAVTAQMIDNFAHGGAAVAVLARALDARLEVIDLGTVAERGEMPGVRRERLGPGSANLARESAMTHEQLSAALAVGRAAVQGAQTDGAQLFIGGDMGIANTTSATALACALLGRSASELAGPGTGLDRVGVQHKTRVIERALALHAAHAGDALEVLRRLGGFEIAALAGAAVACAQSGLPMLVDGFIATAAVLVATRLNAGVGDWMFYAHRSAERGHDAMLDALQARPLLDLGLRLGEGSGAAVAVPLLRMACALHGQMATFDAAQVSQRHPDADVDAVA